MRDWMTIGQLAKAAGVPTTTVRYYERRGLLLPKSRSPHGYRRYDEHSLNQLCFIKSAKARGFALDDIARLLPIRGGGSEECAYVQQIITQRVAVVHEELRELHHIERMLRRTHEACRACSPKARCQTLGELSEATTNQPATPLRYAGSPRGRRR